jgi:PHD-finger
VPITIKTDETDTEKEGNCETVQPCITSMYRLCKICGTCIDGEREFLVCSHPECPYKYYHTACLKKSRVGISMQENSTCWFCPSCLCRVCRHNKDDPLLVLCDGCDEAYHIYCMDPPCESVPVGKWYCGKCSKKRRRKRGKTESYMQCQGSKPSKENGVVPNLQDNDSTKNEQQQQVYRSLDLLITAIDTVSVQEKLPN